MNSSPFFVLSTLPRVRLAVQQLLGGAAVADRPPQASQRVGEKLPVRVGELRSEVAARNELLRLRDSIREVRRRDIDLPHAGMQALERVRVVGWRELSRRHRFVVGPHVDREAVTHVDARLDSRLKSTPPGSRFPRAVAQARLRTRALACHAMGATRATTSQGIRRRTSRFESLRTIASSTVRPSAEAIDIAAATAREASDACIFRYPRRFAPADSQAHNLPQVASVTQVQAIRHQPDVRERARLVQCEPRSGICSVGGVAREFSAEDAPHVGRPRTRRRPRVPRCH